MKTLPYKRKYIRAPLELRITGNCSVYIRHPQQRTESNYITGKAGFRSRVSVSVSLELLAGFIFLLNLCRTNAHDYVSTVFRQQNVIYLSKSLRASSITSRVARAASRRLPLGQTFASSTA